MSQEEALTKLKTISSRLWKEHRLDGDGYDLACSKLLGQTNAIYQKLEQRAVEDILADLSDQLGQGHDKWKPPWERKHGRIKFETEDPDEIVPVIATPSQIFNHPTVVKAVSLVTNLSSDDSFSKQDSSALKTDFSPLQPMWNVDFSKVEVDSAYWQSVKTIKKSHDSPIQHNNAFDPRLFFQGFGSDTHYSEPPCSPPHQKQTTVNVFLSVPNVSDVLEKHTTCYREFCQRCSPLPLKKGSDLDNEWIEELELAANESDLKLDKAIQDKFKEIWRSITDSAIKQTRHSRSATVRRPHPADWRNPPQLSPVTFVPPTLDLSFLLESDNKDVIGSTSSIPVHTSACSPTSTTSSIQSDSLNHEPIPPDQPQQHPARPRTSIRRRLWDDNDLLVSASCKGLEEEETAPLVPGSRSQSDPDLTQSFFAEVESSRCKLLEGKGTGDVQQEGVTDDQSKKPPTTTTQSVPTVDAEQLPDMKFIPGQPIVTNPRIYPSNMMPKPDFQEQPPYPGLFSVAPDWCHAPPYPRPHQTSSFEPSYNCPPPFLPQGVYLPDQRAWSQPSDNAKEPYQVNIASSKGKSETNMMYHTDVCTLVDSKRKSLPTLHEMHPPTPPKQRKKIPSLLDLPLSSKNPSLPEFHTKRMPEIPVESASNDAGVGEDGLPSAYTNFSQFVKIMTSTPNSIYSTAGVNTRARKPPFRCSSQDLPPTCLYSDSSSSDSESQHGLPTTAAQKSVCSLTAGPEARKILQDQLQHEREKIKHKQEKFKMKIAQVAPRVTEPTYSKANSGSKRPPLLPDPVMNDKHAFKPSASNHYAPQHQKFLSNKAVNGWNQPPPGPMDANLLAANDPAIVMNAPNINQNLPYYPPLPPLPMVPDGMVGPVPYPPPPYDIDHFVPGQPAPQPNFRLPHIDNGDMQYPPPIDMNGRFIQPLPPHVQSRMRPQNQYGM